ncbi:uncharacterized protein L201_007656 [Kwoniella dendrophila CBS 6074]|uniref:Nitronate monooxygenase domain-containing protein n=1 Tax=Kwoniella dendrophila CBS 6074 TaxID=1295534 RepID=A0AAX4K749_9TREE
MNDIPKHRSLSSLAEQSLKKLKIKYPIIQAPMAGTSTPLLASTISNNGGLGSLGLGSSNHIQAKKMILETRKLLDKKDLPFNVNLFVHPKPNFNEQVNQKWINRLKPYFEKYSSTENETKTLDALPKELKIIYQSFGKHSYIEGFDPKEEDEEYVEMLDVLLETKPPIISFHFGLPSLKVLKELKDNGSILLCTATNLEEAKIIENTKLIDFIIAQGYEAGGHRGSFDLSKNVKDENLSTFVLTSLLLKKSNLPIIAAGGIMNGNHIKAYMDLGCIACQLGTAFIPCSESSADQPYKDLLFSKASEKTIMTKLISGRPARSIVNKFTSLQDELSINDDEIPEYPITYDAGKQLNALAKKRNEHGFGAHWAGQAAPLARNLDAKELLETLVREWQSQETNGINSKL